LEFANVTDSDATTIGIRLALSHGVSVAMALLEPELTTLQRTLSTNAAMLQTIRHLGEALNALNVNAAPIAALTHARHWPESRMEQFSADVPERTRASAAFRPTAHDVPGRRTRSDRAAPPHPRNMLRPDGDLPAPRLLPRQAMAMASRAAPPSMKVAAADIPGVAIVPTISSPVGSPSSSPSSLAASSMAPRALEMVRSPLPEAGARPADAVPVTTIDGIGAPLDTRVDQIVLGSMAPDQSPQVATDIVMSQDAIDIAASQVATDIPPPHVVARRDGLKLAIIPPYIAADAAVEPEGPPSASVLSELPQAESEPRQAVLVLDSAQLGSWVIDHLERQASRPHAMTTGIDPRMNAAYPGAPTGV
jgi:hypothetical protein